MLGRVVQDVQEHLPQALGVAGDFRDLFVVFQVFQCNAVLGQAAAIHKDRILKFTPKIRHFYSQRHSAVLEPCKVQQLHDHFRQALGLRGNDLQPLSRIRVQFFICKQGLAPAVDNGEGGPQLVGKLGDELRLHLLVLADLYGHFVNGVRQVRDLIVVLGLDLGSVAAVGNALGLLCDLLHRGHDGPDKEAAGEQHNKQCRRQNSQADKSNAHDLPVHHRGRGDKPQNTDDLTAAIDHRAADSHDPLPGVRIPAHKGLDASGGDSLLDFRCLRGGNRPGAVGRGNDFPILVNKLQLQLQPGPVLKGLGIGNAGLVEGVVILPQIVFKKLCGAFGTVLQVRVHIIVAIVGVGCGDHCHAHQSYGDDDERDVHQPSLMQVADFFEGQFHLRAPLIAKAPHRGDIGGIGGIVLDLDAQAADVHIHDLQLPLIILAPHG